nr:butyrophilin subfamily 1 member A1-like isoform X3 [Ovis aries]
MIKLPTVSLAAIGYEKFLWKNITELLKTGMLIIGIYYCRKIYKKLDDLQKKIDKGEQDKYDFQKKFEYSLDKIKATIDKGEQDKYKIKQEKDNIAQEKDNIALEKELNKEIERKKAQFKSAWREIPLYADWRKEEFQTVKLTLDAATAHPALFLSEEGRIVTWQEPCQELPSSPERFVSIPCVLGQLYVSSGRYFWEVEVQDAHSWDLGVCRNNVARTGRVTMSPQNGFRVIRLYDGEYWGLTSPETSLTLKEKPCRVGVFLDYEAGDVSFYNMTDESHIYTFSKQAFYGGLRPLFRLWSSDSGPLVIVQVEENTTML